jgi:AcrR family transcriptional regulator
MTEKVKAPKSQKTKDEIYWSVFDAVIRLDIQKGHMNWKITELARASKISRTLIYYYFGKSKEQIMKSAIDYLGQEFLGLTTERLVLWNEGKVLESVLKSRAMAQKSPHVTFFYMIRKSLDTEVGRAIKELDRRHRKKLQEFYPVSDKDDIEALAAVLFGLIATPNLTDAGVVSALGIIQRNLTFKKPSQNK